MRDDAVLGRALPLDRGLGPSSLYLVNNRRHFDIPGAVILSLPTGLLQCHINWQQLMLRSNGYIQCKLWQLVSTRSWMLRPRHTSPSQPPLEWPPVRQRVIFKTAIVVSVHLSVTCWYWLKMMDHMNTQFPERGSPTFTPWLPGEPNCNETAAYNNGQKTRFSTSKSLYLGNDSK